MASKMSVLSLCVTLATVIALSSGHSYHLGGCPKIDPVPDFKMNSFAGKWYAIQETSTTSRCLTYRYDSEDTKPPNGVYRLEKTSEHHAYTGTVSKNEGATTAANLTQRFPLTIGSAKHIIFMTDYNTYAGVFTCQKLVVANRLAATILSRIPSLDKSHIDEIRSRLATYGVETKDLSEIDHRGCPERD